MMVVVLVAVVNQIPGSNPAASIFLKMGHSRPLYFRLFNTVLIQWIVNKIVDVRIQTSDLWCRKQPLYQLSPNHWPPANFLHRHLFHPLNEKCLIDRTGSEPQTSGLSSNCWTLTTLHPLRTSLSSREIG